MCYSHCEEFLKFVFRRVTVWQLIYYMKDFKHIVSYLVVLIILVWGDNVIVRVSLMLPKIRMVHGSKLGSNGGR